MQEGTGGGAYRAINGGRRQGAIKRVFGVASEKRGGSVDALAKKVQWPLHAGERWKVEARRREKPFNPFAGSERRKEPHPLRDLGGGGGKKEGFSGPK